MKRSSRLWYMLLGIIPLHADDIPAGKAPLFKLLEEDHGHILHYVSVTSPMVFTLVILFIVVLGRLVVRTASQH